MRLGKKDIDSLISAGRVAGMHKDSFVAGFVDSYDGRYYPIDALDASFYADRDCELYTHLAKARGGIECYLRFF